VSILESLEVYICNNNPFFVFSYPTVYIICTLPMSIARWMYFNGSTVPQQFTLFASGLFSFCGLFDAILFFLTRPNLVVGTTDSPPPTLVTNAQSEPSGGVELPFIHNHTAADSVPLDVERGSQQPIQALYPNTSPRGRRYS